MLYRNSYYYICLCAQTLHSLVDYDEDSDEEQPSDTDGDLSRDPSSSPAKRQKLENS